MSSIKDFLSADEIRQLSQRSDARGWWAICRTWLLIGSSFALLAQFPHPVTYLLVVFILGGQHLACAILSHEAAHYSLFKTRSLNQSVADWLCARPSWLDVARYRQHHLGHHAHTGTAKDPDTSLVSPFPCSRLSMWRKLLRDISGITGIRRVVGLLLMDIGVLKYTVSVDIERLPRNGRSVLDYAKTGLKNLGPMLLCNGIMAGILAACGVLWVYTAWVLAYLTTFSLFLRIRSIAEHACLQPSADVLRNTRTTRAGWLAKLTVAPMNVNYHLEHHLMASVPFYKLPQLHALLRQKGVIDSAPSYWEVLKLASGKA